MKVRMWRCMALEGNGELKIDNWKLKIFS